MFFLRNVKYKEILQVEELQIPSQKSTCIVGESGSGKTTLLKLLNDLISCDSGEVFYRDMNMIELDPVRLRREVVMLPQVPVIFPGNVRNNLLAGLIFSEKPHLEDDRLGQALKKVNLNIKLDRDPEELSGGEKQRLALCRVMLMDPEVLLLDEPSSALDEDTEYFVMDEIIKYTRSGKKTSVMVTHSKNLARKYGETIITVDKGRVIRVEEVSPEWTA